MVLLRRSKAGFGPCFALKAARLSRGWVWSILSQGHLDFAGGDADRVPKTKRNDTDRTRTCDSNESRFLVYRLNRSATVSRP